MDFLKKGQKIRAWVDPPPHSGNARKKTFFFHWCLPLFEEYLRNCVNQTLHKHFAFYNKNAISSFQDSLVSYILWNIRYATPHIIVALRTPRNGERKYGYDADCWHPKRFPAIKFSDFPQNKHMSNDQVQYLLVKDCVRFWFLNFSLYTQWSTLSALSSGRGWTFLMTDWFFVILMMILMMMMESLMIRMIGRHERILKDTKRQWLALGLARIPQWHQIILWQRTSACQCSVHQAPGAGILQCISGIRR